MSQMSPKGHELGCANTDWPSKGCEIFPQRWPSLSLRGDRWLPQPNLTGKKGTKMVSICRIYHEYEVGNQSYWVYNN
jgi:hypothetical protein